MSSAEREPGKSGGPTGAGTLQSLARGLPSRARAPGLVLQRPPRGFRAATLHPVSSHSRGRGEDSAGMARAACAPRGSARSPGLPLSGRSGWSPAKRVRCEEETGRQQPPCWERHPRHTPP